MANEVIIGAFHSEILVKRMLASDDRSSLMVSPTQAYAFLAKALSFIYGLAPRHLMPIIESPFF